ncbi:family 10 glycosylhydrolase [Fulvivirga sp. M361]|uniref:family 10 glycosylhydrolase n=1 Tax=Fulvivirga sp. M361 TaxID=2594266 RepID=UPI00117B283C|nr:family 10 glycosylhydrolase [Fulvivirga sp. M361]TRX53376.1 family 10 glycosylhydrolase [Fulvivirga sp. M361]
MKKRTFIKKAGLGTLAMAGMGLTGLQCKPKEHADSPQAAQPLAKQQKNWAWINPQEDWKIDDWKKKLTLAKSNGFDALLMNVYNGRSAYFESADSPVQSTIAHEVVKICQSIDMEFHAWMFTMPCNIPEIVQQHPDWFAVNRKGESAASKPAYVDYYKFLCPCNEEAMEFVRQNVISVSSIPGIDGVHFDYIRLPDVILAEGLQPKYNIVQDKEYPEYDYCYSSYCIDKFKALTGIDPLTDIRDHASHQQWRQFRYDSITQLVNNLWLPEIKKKDLMATAAVFPNWESVRQEWHKWDLDGFLPMLYHNFYNEGIAFIEEHTRKNIQRLKKFNNLKPIWSGIFLPEIDNRELSQAVAHARNGGSQGIALYALDSASDDQIITIGKSLTSV